ncbi:hypothetical protein [Dyella mobilis]|uniref:Uncharacterized protein n=1 Tax=Dyella mobilis TaxID=1849582 RepID=A0ABS2KJB8_9GAMM|nr:hypothetical protein [Dyella mobilis]MBM7131120.1 hypothetical protein [Dyella mobilis]GLQ98946.1 hypothetical protein GCM10007863_33660 [Dyella mobilis]
MNAMNLDSPLDQLGGDVRRTSPDPREGYVLNPWSGMYQETEATYHDRLHVAEALPA